MRSSAVRVMKAAANEPSGCGSPGAEEGCVGSPGVSPTTWAVGLAVSARRRRREFQRLKVRVGSLSASTAKILRGKVCGEWASSGRFSYAQGRDRQRLRMEWCATQSRANWSLCPIPCSKAIYRETFHFLRPIPASLARYTRRFLRSAVSICLPCEQGIQFRVAGNPAGGIREAPAIYHAIVVAA
jgi:hypothetical protein